MVCIHRTFFPLACLILTHNNTNPLPCARADLFESIGLIGEGARVSGQERRTWAFLRVAARDEMNDLSSTLLDNTPAGGSL